MKAATSSAYSGRTGPGAEESYRSIGQSQLPSKFRSVNTLDNGQQQTSGERDPDEDGEPEPALASSQPVVTL